MTGSLKGIPEECNEYKKDSSEDKKEPWLMKIIFKERKAKNK